jgi:eukaryotic-like serine/threonine-protein kinase
MNEESIFMEALEKHTPEGRAAFLDQACVHNSDLRHSVELLLKAHEKAGHFLQDVSRLGPNLDVLAPSELCGTVIGPYKLLQQIGEGGMGVVFMAEQTQPVQRKVALKVIKPGMDSRQVIARFEAERQALALMDHINIARVLDAGATESGRPYFVMELVTGVPITKYCDDNHLTPRERLELFVPVCQAIQHAHQKGIIHRDIKPSNVLVTLYDGRPVSKVIDFGVAKATEQRLTERTLFTQFGTMVGTLEYMSPEQAESSALGIDTRSDIYSLGVLLYELLTGSTPLERKRVREMAHAEILRMIKEDEPPRPSTRLSGSGEALASISAQRKMEPAKLSKLMRGELDWIVMKCLEKDRNRRYETANGFAADVRRYLAGEPVQACPPSSGYRLRKFVQRNKAAVAAGVCILTMLAVVAVGASLAVWQLNEKEKATHDQLRLTERAQDEGLHRLYDARLAQAQALRLSRRVGQKFDSLKVLADAAKILPDQNMLEDRLLEPRNAAIACLPLPDLRTAKVWNGWPTGSVNVSFDGNLERYARVDRLGVVHIHRTGDEIEIVAFPGTGPGIGWPLLSPNGKFLALQRDGEIHLKIWNLAGPEPVVLMEGASATGGIAFSPDSTHLATGQPDGSISLYDLPSGRQAKTLNGIPRPRSLAFHPEGRQLAVRSATGIQIYDLDTRKLLNDLPQLQGLEEFAWHPDGKTLAVAGLDHIIRIWDVATGKPLTHLAGHKSDGIKFVYNHTGDLLVSIAWDGILRLWDPRMGQQLFNSHANLRCLRFSPDDRFLAAVAADTKLHMLEVSRSSAYHTLVGNTALWPASNVTACAVRPNGRLLAVTSEAGVSFYDLARHNQLGFARIGRTRSVVFESSNAFLTSGPAGLLRWPIQEDTGSPGLLRIGPPTKLLPNWGEAFGCSADGRVIAIPQSNGAGGLVVDQDHLDRPIPLTPHKDVRFAAVSPDRKWAATGSHAGTKVKIWETRTGEAVKELPIDTGSLVGFSPDGKWLATSGGGLSLWTVGSWNPGKRIGGKDFAFSPDGQMLAVETEHGVVRLVDPDSGREYAQLESPNQERTYRICFSPDGAQLIALTQDSQTVHIWDLREIREQLTNMHLDWDSPPYPPAPKVEETQSLRIQIDLGYLAQLSEGQKPVTQADLEKERQTVAANPNDSEACNELAWHYLTAPLALRDWRAALPLAQKAVQLAPTALHRNTLGLAYYRAGRYREAVEALQLNLKDQVDWGLAYDLYFLAMSHHQLGESARARQFYNLAVRWSGTHEVPTDVVVELATFKVEAADLLGVKDKKP